MDISIIWICLLSCAYLADHYPFVHLYILSHVTKALNVEHCKQTVKQSSFVPAMLIFYTIGSIDIFHSVTLSFSDIDLSWGSQESKTYRFHFLAYFSTDQDES